MSNIAVLIYGPPGAGKGTQANLLAWRKEFIHFDTGKYLEQLVHSPKFKNNKVIQKEKRLFDGGKLLTPSFVLKVTSKKAKEIANAGFDIVFSGSPRTLFEAFGNPNNKDPKGLVKILEEIYGKKNIYPILLKIKPETSIQRNKNRLVCAICKTAVLHLDILHKHKTCPLCGGKLVRRTLDDPTVAEVRIKEYKERTFPILKKLKKMGYKIISVDGTAMPYKVHERIMKSLPAI